MAGRITPTETKVLGRVSSYKPTLQQQVDKVVVPDAGQSKPIVPVNISARNEVISAAPEKKRAPLGRLVSAVLPERFSKPILDTASQVGKFLAPPTFSDQMVRALDEMPGSTNEQLTTRAKELDVEQGIMTNPTNPFEDRWAMDDFTGGTIKQKLPKAIERAVIKKLALTQDDKVINGLLTKHAPELSETQRTIVANVVKPLNDEKKIATVLQKATFAAEGKPVQPTLDLGADIPKGRVITPRLPEVVDAVPAAPVKPKTFEEAMTAYEKDVIQKNKDAAEAQVLGADDMKDYFGKDYGDDRHPIYSKATFNLFKKLVPESKSDRVILTGGGPGSGKTDFLIKPVKQTGFDGVLYDSNMSSVEGARNQLQIIRDAGKKPLVKGIIPDIDTARKYTILRGNKSGRYVTDEAFARGHAGFPNTIRELLEKGELSPDEVHLFDFRSIKSLEEIQKVLQLNLYQKDPVAFLKKLKYSEDDVRDKYSATKFDGKTGRRLSDTGVRPGSSDILDESRADTPTKPTADSGGVRQVLRSDDNAGGASGVRGDGTGGTRTPEKLPNTKLETRVKEATSFEDFYTKTGITREALDVTAQKKGYADALDYYERTKSAFAEDDTLQLTADVEKGSDFVLQKSAVEQEKISSNLRAIFADMKGVTLDDVTLKFNEEQLDQAERNYEILMDSLMDDPARALVKYMSKTTGRLPEVTGKETMQSLRGGSKPQTVKNSEFGRRGDQILQEIFGYERQMTREEAQSILETYLKRRNDAVEVFQSLKDIRHNIRLAKQAEVFVGAHQTKLAKELATNLQSLQKIVQAAERGGFRKGLSVGTQKYTAMVDRLKTRRNRITGIKKAYNLTDAQMRDVRGTADPRFMTATEFDAYINEIQAKAELVQRKTTERVIIDAIIAEKDIKKSENLQRALEFPPVKDMSLEQLVEFSDILAKTRYGDTFLGPRMIQTAVNTDLGKIRTIQDGIDAVVKQTGMEVKAGSVDGSKVDSWLRDATLVDKDPLHKLFITEWVGKEVDMLGRKALLQQELNKLARASRASRKRGLWDRIAPQDPLPVEYSQTAPNLLPQMEAKMTKEEIAFGKFLRGFFERYYELVQMDAANRFTLRGVKYSRFKDMYFPHMSRQFFERAREDGFVKAIRILWDSNVAESKIDFNAFGDRGEVLGYEKWFKNSMKREAEDGAYTKNAPKTALAYFHAFEKKLLLDSMIPKAKLYEFLLAKRYQTPKSVNNPDGAEKIHSVLTKHINEWLNNKKGQRVKMVYEQGDSVEAVVDASSMLVSMIDLGGNLVTQLASATGGEIMTLRGAGIKGWKVGHTRSMTGQGRQLGHKYAGVIGETPWNELASVANDVGDTLRGGLFYIFGDLAYRARRQMFLGLLTKDEFVTGNITQKRIGEIKLQMGKWHTMPEFRSVNGSTSLLKAAGKYTEWATPMFQTAVSDVVKLRNEIRVAGNDPKKLAKVVRSKPFLDTLNTVLVGAGTYLLGQYIFQPETADKETWAGQIRIKAAQEAGSIIQGASGIGVFSNMRMSGFVSDLADALLTLANMETYATAGPGHDKGDLKAPDAFAKLLIPKFVKQFLPTPETPLRTKEDIISEVKQGIDDGTLTVSAAKEKYIAEMASLKEAETKRRFELPRDEYIANLKERLDSKAIDVATAKAEFIKYNEQKKKQEPESFESDSDATFIDKVKVYAEAVGTDPITAFSLIFQGESIRRTDNGAIIVKRMSFEESTKKKKELGSRGDLVLDHTIPLQIGGTNGDSNLKLIPKEEWERYTPVENFLGQALRTEDISERQARQLITDFKAGKITEEEVYAKVEELSQ